MLSDKNLEILRQLKPDLLRESQELRSKQITQEVQTRKHKREDINHQYHWLGKNNLLCCCICRVVFAERNFKEHYYQHLRPEKRTSNSLKEIHSEIAELTIYFKTIDGGQDSQARKRYELLQKEYIKRKTNSGYVRIVQGGNPK